jgi:GNAT superfamily N-acetyltransferase
MDFEALQKAVADLAASATTTEPVSTFFTGNQTYDYSHLLSPELRKIGYRLYVDHSDYGQLAAHLFCGKHYAGGVDGQMNGTDLYIEGAQVENAHRGQGLGTPLYEALLAHAVKFFNAARWLGAEHSTAAHKLHERLTAKHGLRYEGGALNPNVQAAPAGDFDKKFQPYAVHLKSEIDAAEELLAKVLPTPTFPKLGMGDDRRETKLIHTDTQHQTMQGVLGNMAPKKLPTGKRIPIATRRAVGQELVDSKEVGGTFTDANGKGTAVSFAKPTSQNPRATMLHEDTHRMFQRVETQYGMQARQNLARNMMDALPKAFQQIVRNHGKLAGATQIPDEESLGYVISYVNSPEHRQMFHAKHDPQRAKVYGSVMKRVYKHLQGVAGVVNENWLGDKAPWSK